MSRLLVSNYMRDERTLVPGDHSIHRTIPYNTIQYNVDGDFDEDYDDDDDDFDDDYHVYTYVDNNMLAFLIFVVCECW